MSNEKEIISKIPEFDADVIKGYTGPTKPNNSPSVSQVPKVNPPTNQSQPTSNSGSTKENK